MTQTWHHGLIALWWQELIDGGEDIARFQELITAPALDLGCGAGRLLLPMLQAGLDVDGADATADMIAACRARLDAAGLDTALYVQAAHELDIPRTYQSIFMCGAFGLGSSRADDLDGLRRCHAHLEAGGSLILDHYLPTSEPRAWRSWIEQREYPRPWPTDRGAREAIADGTELDMVHRVIDFDPLELTSRRELQVRQYRGDEVIAEDTFGLTSNLYFKPEIDLMLKVAGFAEVVCYDGLTNQAPQPWGPGYLLFVARKAR